jgi:hypothetical protein
MVNCVRCLSTGDRFPSARTYLSSRTYGGWAKTRLNPEPYAYESGFSVKWLIEQQLKGEPALNYDPAKGEVKVPWLSWGPYLWARGTDKRSDGFSYETASPSGTRGWKKAPSASLRQSPLCRRTCMPVPRPVLSRLRVLEKMMPTRRFRLQVACHGVLMRA